MPALPTFTSQDVKDRKHFCMDPTLYVDPGISITALYGLQEYLSIFGSMFLVISAIHPDFIPQSVLDELDQWLRWQTGKYVTGNLDLPIDGFDLIENVEEPVMVNNTGQFARAYCKYYRGPEHGEKYIEAYNTIRLHMIDKLQEYENS